MEEVTRQIKKGILDIVILKLLSQKEMYGYELMSKLETAGMGYFAMREGTLYPVLYRLEDAGYVQSSWEKEKQKRGVPRKYYSLTPSGGEYLDFAKSELVLFIDAIKNILEVI